MHRVRLISWKAPEAERGAAHLRELGYEVGAQPLTPALLRALRETPADAFVIDLSRLPSQGRDVAVGLRIHKATRHVPLVFIGGAPDKVARVRELLPDALYTDWDGIGAALADAIAHPPLDPVVPASQMAGYSGTPLPKKLGIKSGSTVVLVEAPEGFDETLDGLPDGVVLHWSAAEAADVTVWFVRSLEALRDGIAHMAPLRGAGRLWIAWPKKASGVESDVSERLVREVGLAAGLVDFKIAAIDATWSGLCFTRRKTEPD
jgi:hypothetical protein